MSDRPPLEDTNIEFKLGITTEGRVLLDFEREVDHIKLTPDQALELAEYLVETAKQAVKGRVIVTGKEGF